jgi:arabinose-5-phosphate isomerase
MEHVERAKEVISIEIEGLQSVMDSLDSEFDAAVQVLLSCIGANHKIIVTGVGKNLHIAQKVSATLASTGSTSVVLSPTQAMHGDFGIVTPGDVLLAFSDSGESEELLNLIPAVKRIGVPIIAVTRSAQSALGESSDVVVQNAVPREACPFNMAPTASTTAALAIGDALAMVLLDATGLDKSAYAKLHPGGAIGRTLLLRVADIMRTDDRLAIVSGDTTVQETVLAMTSARSGTAAVVDENNKLVGIVTDGDLRRGLSSDTDLLNRAAADIMTAAPVTIGPERLAVHVLRLFEEKDIDDILVVDADSHVVGAIDIQDLPKLKIM